MSAHFLNDKMALISYYLTDSTALSFALTIWRCECSFYLAAHGEFNPASTLVSGLWPALGGDGSDRYLVQFYWEQENG